jgi:hypothetical protein
MQITAELREAVKRAMWGGGNARTADRLAYEEIGPGADEVLTKLADDAIAAALPLIRGAVVEECAAALDGIATGHRRVADMHNKEGYARGMELALVAAKTAEGHAAAIRALSPREAGE